MMEKQAKKKEDQIQLSKVAGQVQDGNPEDIKENMAINDMYVEAI